MNNKIKIQGKLKTYLQTTLLLGILLAVVDIWIYVIDVKAGIILSCFVVFYLTTVLLLLGYNKQLLMNEMINFATQYGQIQKKLLRDLELPHALLDENGRVIWTNKAFEDAVGKEKGFTKSITLLFPALTRDKLPRTGDAEISFQSADKEYLAKMHIISLRETMENSDIFATGE